MAAPAMAHAVLDYSPARGVTAGVLASRSRRSEVARDFRDAGGGNCGYGGNEGGSTCWHPLIVLRTRVSLASCDTDSRDRSLR